MGVVGPVMKVSKCLIVSSGTQPARIRSGSRMPSPTTYPVPAFRLTDPVGPRSPLVGGLTQDHAHVGFAETRRQIRRGTSSRTGTVSLVGSWT